MKLTYAALLLALTACQSTSPSEQALIDDPIQSRIIKTEASDVVLVQEILVEAPVKDVWNAYTTEEGWTSWAVTHAQIDLRAGGMFRTHYGADAKIGDPGTITLHVVNYVPERLLTLRAELEDRWPDVMKENPENLMSVVVFEPLGEHRTRVQCYGVGYRDSAAYDNLMNFFIPANEGLFQKLKDYLEQ